MCTVSMVGDHYRDIWKDRPWYPPNYPRQPIWPGQIPNQLPSGGIGSGTITIYPQPEISRAEFDELKRQVAEMKELLKRAKAYDEATGQADCEMDEKMDILRKVAKMVGVDLGDVLGKATPANQLPQSPSPQPSP